MTVMGKTIDGNMRDGRLICIGSNCFEGTKRLPNGKFDRKKFRMPRKQAVERWRQWRDEEWRQQAKSENREFACDEAKKEGETEVMATTTAKKADDGKLYALAVVGGAPLYVFKSFDKASSVCDALTQAAKASGFAAKYDVVEVREWQE